MMEETQVELNIDALPGLTHHYGGHAFGNLSSMQNKKKKSYPKDAALQSLEKMRLVHLLGVPQMVFPPHLRPSITTLRALGFSGNDEQVIQKACKEIPSIYYKLSSSAGMWMANAATVSAAQDTEDGKVHFTPANLCSSLHRAIEPSFTSCLLKKAFSDPQFFVHHCKIPYGQFFSDEGSANFLRLFTNFSSSSLSIFSWGKKAFDKQLHSPLSKFPLRQALEASQAVARQHLLDKRFTLFFQQSLEAIDLGCFHLDLLAASHKSFILIHEKAFTDISFFIERIRSVFLKKNGQELVVRVVSEEELPLSEALETFFFNSQLITSCSKKEIILSSNRCKTSKRAHKLLETLIKDPAYPIDEVRYLDLSQSLLGGGGPGCLRLRVPLSLQALKNVHQPLILNDILYFELKKWIYEYYPDSLEIKDLQKLDLIKREQKALKAIAKILHLGSIYDF